MAKSGALWRVTYRVDADYYDMDFRAPSLEEAYRRAEGYIPTRARLVGGGRSTADLDSADGEWRAAS